MSQAPKTPLAPDAVDRIADQWTRERPDLDLTAMTALGRLKRCAALVATELDKVFSHYGMSSGDFDVLATLRRSGAPFCLAPTALFSTLMVTSGTMTHRLTQLEKKGWIERVSNDQDARSKLVRLSSDGLALINEALGPHVSNLSRLTDGLSQQELDGLNLGLRGLLRQLENAPAEQGGE